MKRILVSLMVLIIVSCGDTEKTEITDPAELLEQLGPYTFDPNDPRSPKSLGPTSKELVAELTGLPIEKIHVLKQKTQFKQAFDADGNKLAIFPSGFRYVGKKLLVTDGKTSNVYEINRQMDRAELVYSKDDYEGMYVSPKGRDKVEFIDTYDYIYVIDGDVKRKYKNIYNLHVPTHVQGKLLKYAKDKQYLFNVYDKEMRLEKSGVGQNIFKNEYAEADYGLNDLGDMHLSVGDGVILVINKLIGNYAIYDIENDAIVKYVGDKFVKIKEINNFRNLDKQVLPQPSVFSSFFKDGSHYLLFSLLNGPFVLKISNIGEMESAYILDDFGVGMAASLVILDEEEGESLYTARWESSTSDSETTEQTLFRYYIKPE